MLDKLNKVIAWRNVLISEANRCFCVWQCACSCTTIEDQSFTSNCKIISKEQYNNAGFQGAIPPVLRHNTKWNIIHLTIIILTTYCFIVFLIGNIYIHTYICNVELLQKYTFTGTIKAFIGLCYKPIGSFGLYLIFHKKSKTLNYYLEPEICSICVIYDTNGYAVHPFTEKRTVRLVSK